MSRNVRVAAASTDGKVINQHFGHAESFYIFDIDINNISFEYIENREIEPCCNNYSHSEQAFENVASKLSDCKAILVSQIGDGAVSFLESKGFEVFEAPFPIEDVLLKIARDTLL